jgi:hypothetical protein
MKAVESKIDLIPIKTEKEWEKIFKAQEASKLSRSNYCRINKLNLHAFRYWYKKIRNQPIKPLIPITIKSEYEKLPERASKVLSTLTLNNGNVIHIYDQEILLLLLSKLL